MIAASEAKAQPATQEQEAIAAERAAEADTVIAHVHDIDMAHGWQDHHHQMFVGRAAAYRASAPTPVYGPWNLAIPQAVAGLSGNCLSIV